MIKFIGMGHSIDSKIDARLSKENSIEHKEYLPLAQTEDKGKSLRSVMGRDAMGFYIKLYRAPGQNWFPDQLNILEGLKFRKTDDESVVETKYDEDISKDFIIGSCLLKKSKLTFDNGGRHVHLIEEFFWEIRGDNNTYKTSWTWIQK